VKHTAAITGGCPICHTFVPTAVNLFHCTISRYQNIPIAYILNMFYHWLEIIMSNWYNLVFTCSSIVNEQNFAIHNYHFCQLNVLKFKGFWGQLLWQIAYLYTVGAAKFRCRSYSAGRLQWPRGLRLGLRSLVCWNCGLESRRENGCLYVVSVVFCQVEDSAPGWSPVQRSPTECGLSNGVWSWGLDNEEAMIHWEILRYEKEILQHWEIFFIEHSDMIWYMLC
jgi:hypothetical protein